MKITDKDVRYVAALANLELTDEETARFVTDMNSILGYIDKLNELDTSNVEPMAQVLYAADETATLRPDQDRPGLPLEAVLADAPESGAGQFKVPKVIER